MECDGVPLAHGLAHHVIAMECLSRMGSLIT